jgi:hypothetical protein
MPSAPAPAPALRADLVSAVPRIAAHEVRLVRPDTPNPVELLAEHTQQAPVSGDGFLTGAFKKTGASILRTGRKTGGSIVDAVRGLGGAVLRAIPTL